MSLSRDNKLTLWRAIRSYKLKRLSEKIARSILIIGGIILLAIGGIAKGDVESDITNIVLNTSSHRLLSIENSVATIVVGESQVAKELRLQAEAEAKLKAEQEAKALALAASKVKKYSDHSSFEGIYIGAGQMFGVDHKLLRAVHIVETGASGSTSRANPSGATGPMQFLRSTFNRYGVDGNGDGVKDITNVYDAIYSAARYLKACGYPDVKKALWGYNPSTRYYNKVMSVYASL